VADLVDLSSRLACHLTLTRADEAFARAIGPWGFSSPDQGLTWRGQVPGADRLRFLGMVSRYAALIGHLSLEELAPGEVGVPRA
jgi:ABC-2 type transport system ATP-binding protein